MENINTVIGARLRAKRKTSGLSQEKLGKLLDLTFQQIQKYESGFTQISVSRLYQICGILKVNIGYFIDDMKKGASADEYSAKEISLVRSFRKIKNPKAANGILFIAKVLADD